MLRCYQCRSVDEGTRTGRRLSRAEVTPWPLQLGHPEQDGRLSQVPKWKVPHPRTRSDPGTVTLATLRPTLGQGTGQIFDTHYKMNSLVLETFAL